MANHTHRIGAVLGIPVDRMSPIELRAWLLRALAGTRTRRIVTLNPELAVFASRDRRYATVLRTADLITADGVGIALALRLLGYGAFDRLTGTDVIDAACAVAEEQGSPIAFLLRPDGLTAAPLLRSRLRDRWPELSVSIAAVDPRAPLDDAIRRAIMDAAPAFLVVGFGHPTQEQWITEYVDAFPSLRVVVGVGGAVDYLSGAIPQPPAMLRRYGLEWLWRLFRQPRRWRRIIDATAVFLAVVGWDAARRALITYRRRDPAMRECAGSMTGSPHRWMSRWVRIGMVRNDRLV